MATLTVGVDRTLAFPNTQPLIDTVRFTNTDAGGVPMATLTLAAKEFDAVHFRSALHLTGFDGNQHDRCNRCDDAEPCELDIHQLDRP